MTEFSVKEFVQGGSSPFREWFGRLDPAAANKVATALYRLQHGNFSHVKSIGSGVCECKIDFGPGYRIYFGQDGKTLIILLCGGTKKMQQKDIEKAKMLWQEYKSRKKQEG